MGRKICFLILLWLCTAHLYSQELKGHLPLRYFAPAEYQALHQNYCLAKDQSGRIYVGNQSGLLVYDGEKWEHQPLLIGQAIHSLLYQKNTNQLIIGSNEEIWAMDLTSHAVKSIKDSLQVNQKIISILSFQNELIICDAHSIYKQTANSWIAIKTFQNKITRAFTVENKCFINVTNEGLYTYANSSINLLINANKINNELINDIITIQGELHWITSNGHLINKEIQTKFIDDPLHYEGNYVKNVITYKSNNKTYNSIGCSNGLFIVDENNTVLYTIDKSQGLANESVNAQMLDDQGNLWLALNKGLAKVQINSPIETLGESYGYEGIIKDMTYFNNQLYLATLQGVFVQKGQGFQKISAPGLNTQCWDLQEYNHGPKNSLLVVSNKGIVEIDKNNNSKIILPCYAYSISPSKFYPNRFYIALNDGITCLENSNGHWKEKAILPKTGRAIKSIYEINENQLFLGDRYDGNIEKIELSYRGKYLNGKSLYKNNNLFQGNTNYMLPISFKDKILLGTSHGIYQWEDSLNNFVHSPLNAYLSFDHALIYNLSPDDNGNLWLVHQKKDNMTQFHVGYLHFDGPTPQWVGYPFARVEEGVVHAIYHKDGNTTYLGGTEGLYKVNTAKIRENLKAPLKKYPLKLQSVVLNGDSVLFEDNHILPNPHLHYHYNNLRFVFAAQDHIDNRFKEYAYFLEGFHSTWSAWGKEAKASFTNLQEGDYVFKVKSRNTLTRASSNQVAYPFSILPPWYRTWWARVLFILGFVLLISSLFWQYINVLRRQVKKATRQIKSQRDELFEVNQELSQKNKVIELKSEEIDKSIRYSQSIQRSVIPTKDELKTLLPGASLLFLPRDVVSGDFYWASKIDEKVYFSVADCTGHGIPGAFISMLCASLYNMVVNKEKIDHTDAILNASRTALLGFLTRRGQAGKEGMDTAFCIFDTKTLKLEFSGAHNGLYLIKPNNNALPLLEGNQANIHKEVFQDQILYDFKPDKMPVGYHFGKEGNAFSRYTIQLEKGDQVFLYTDGFADQFGGENDKKFKYKPFKELLVMAATLKPYDQEQLLLEKFMAWRGTTEQTDDVCVMGLQV